MPFEDKENLTDLKTFTDAVYFNDDVHFYGDIYGLTEVVKNTITVVGLGSTSIIQNGNSSVSVGTGQTITITTDSIGIVTFTKDNIGIANTITLQNTGIVQQLFENATISSLALTGIVNLDVLSGTLFYFTANASDNWIFNVRGNSSTTLNSILPIGKTATITVLCTQGSTARYPTSFRIDGASVAPKWIESTAPTVGFVNSINVYTYAIIKTANSSFTVLASQSRFG